MAVTVFWSWKLKQGNHSEEPVADGKAVMKYILVTKRDSSDPGFRDVAGCCVRGDEPTAFVKGFRRVTGKNVTTKRAGFVFSLFVLAPRNFTRYWISERPISLFSYCSKIVFVVTKSWIMTTCDVFSRDYWFHSLVLRIDSQSRLSTSCQLLILGLCILVTVFQILQVI